MNFAEHLKRSAVLGLAISILITLALSTWMFRAEESDLRLQHRQRLAVMHANALALAVANTNVEETGKRVSDIQKLDPRIESVIIVGGMQLVASTRTEDAAPRQLGREEKALFDLSDQIRTARETNRGEDVVRKKTVQIEEKTIGHIVVTVPYLSDGQFAGILQMKFNTTGPDVSGADIFSPAPDSYTLPALLFLAALLAGSLFRMSTERKVDFTKLLALGVFLLIALFFQQQRLERLERTVTQANQAIAANYLAAAQQYDRLGYLALPRDNSSVTLWDTDHYQRPLGLIAADGSVSAKTQAAYFDKRSGFLKRILGAIDLLGAAVLLMFLYGYAARTFAALKEHADAYTYVAPAMIGMLVLVFFPFAYGITLSFTDTTLFNEFLPFQDRLIGWANFKAILGDVNLYERTASGIIWNYQNFYWTLLVTVAWTISNVTIGVTVGFLLAMALNTEGLRGKAIYRVLLILPWAIPNYITALVWRGMFHPQFGVINQVLQMFGMQPVAWFDGVFSSFFTGVATNGWLSFPFMMVVILGALQSIPKDMYEAAEVEGADRWQRLRYITLPLLRPTLIPAIVLSVVWTFNMFNIIFLVSGGEPGGANEILITKAYKIAFENYQYAYAAAYSTVIFMILLVYGIFQTRITKATESF
jgi:arabinogalactan oligomer / maltooligosaccharide transport system permease protein